MTTADDMLLSLWPVPRLIPTLAARTTMEAIIWKVADRYRLHPKEIRARYGPKAYVPAQHEAMWLCYETGLWSNKQIGMHFGGRDHTTVVYARQKHEARMAALARLAA